MPGSSEERFEQRPDWEIIPVWYAVSKRGGGGPPDRAGRPKLGAKDDASALDILIVEDDALVALHIEGLLRSWGYRRTAITINSADTIAAVRDRRPALVLVDIRIGDRDVGIELAREIIGEFGVPVVFVTGQDNEKIGEAMRAVGPADIVLKPFTGEKLREVVERILPPGD